MKKRQVGVWMKPVTTGLAAGIMAVGCLSAESGITDAKDSATVGQAPTAGVEAPVAVPYSKPGFHVEVDKKDGRLWVFRTGSDDLKAFQTKGKPAKQVLRPGAGPQGITLKSTESSTILEYVATKPGFHVEVDAKDERLWVFRTDSDDLKAFQTKGKPAKQAIRPGAGPFGVTLKSTEMDAIVAYLVAQPGFYTHMDAKDGRLWVFKQNSEDLKAFQTKGKPAKQVLRPGAGPLGLTLKSTEASVLDAYQAMF